MNGPLCKSNASKVCNEWLLQGGHLPCVLNYGSFSQLLPWLVAYVGYIFQQGTFTSNPKHKRIATYYILTYVCIAPFNLQLYNDLQNVEN